MWQPGQQQRARRLNMQKNKEESARLAKQIRAKKRQCYYNAFSVIFYVKDFAGADYVEGYAVTREGLAIEHGWIEANGEILDPTLPDDDVTYFPGLRWRGERGIAEAMRIPKDTGTSDLPFFYRFGWGGSGSPEFMKAWEQAKNFVNELTAKAEQSTVVEQGAEA
jgi:hypothetical protein